MANEGWIKLYRKVQKSFVWSDANLYKLWTLCLMKASHSGNRMIFNGEEVAVHSGEFVTGRNALTFEMNQGAKPAQQVHSDFVWRSLKKLEKAKMLHINSSNRYSVISIDNWDEYQQTAQPADNQPTSNRHPADTIKNAKNEKKKKSAIYADDSDELRLAKLLQTLMDKNNPNRRHSEDIQKWADVVRLMKERDHRTPEQIEFLIEWSQANSFWSGNILSMTKLRAQFDKLVIQVKRDRGVPSAAATPEVTSSKDDSIHDALETNGGDVEEVIADFEADPDIPITRKEVEDYVQRTRH
ncbi:replication protein [Furfurilactobacillus entadae]|uniref:replication protein n=1 Tax=Furfurilactobacillus entadae TaxID=2922307 RepID=UPI0035EC7C4D